jgi:prophage maintenance system killer protein
MSAIKYFHFNRPNQKSYGPKIPCRFQSKTVAVLAISGHQIMQIARTMLEDKTDTAYHVNLMVGITRVNPKDSYSKSIGRDESTKKMAEVSAEIDTIEISKTHIFIRLVPIQGIRMNLRVNKRTGFSTVTGYMMVNDITVVEKSNTVDAASDFKAGAVDAHG